MQWEGSFTAPHFWQYFIAPTCVPEYCIWGAWTKPWTRTPHFGHNSAFRSIWDPQFWQYLVGRLWVWACCKAFPQLGQYAEFSPIWLPHVEQNICNRIALENRYKALWWCQYVVQLHPITITEIEPHYDYSNSTVGPFLTNLTKNYIY